MENVAEDTEISHPCYNYVIMKQVLQYMDWQNLKNMENVCKLWQQIANDLRRTMEPCVYCVEVENENLKVNSTGNTYVEPGLIVTFSKPKFIALNFPKKLKFSFEGTKHGSILFRYMCYNFFFGLDKIVDVWSDRIFHVPPVTKPQFNKSSMLLSGFSIPNIPGVSFTEIKITEDELNSDGNNEKLNEILRTEIIKCMIVFAAEEISNNYEDFLQKMIINVHDKQISEPFAVGGCIIKLSHGVDVQKSDMKRKNLHIIVIAVNKFQKENVQFDTLSKVFPFYKTKNGIKHNFRNGMKEICDALVKRRYSICLKFSCFKRKTFYDIEDAVISEYLPESTVVGCEAMGEIGIDCLPETNSENDTGEPLNKKVCSDAYKDCIHSFSTILMILSWGSRV